MKVANLCNKQEYQLQKQLCDLIEKSYILTLFFYMNVFTELLVCFLTCFPTYLKIWSSSIIRFSGFAIYYKRAKYDMQS